MPADVIRATQRLLIRELAPEDRDEFYVITSDPEVIRHLAFGVTSPAESLALLDYAIASRGEPSRASFAFAVEETATGRLVGSCGLNLAPDDARSAEIYFVFRRASWGSGYATEVACAVLDFGFGELGLHRIWGHAMVGNGASVRVMERSMMAREGMARGVILSDGQWHDAVQYAILDSDPR
jgi:ribosomal-protein-alanine N-acetyltransferase